MRKQFEDTAVGSALSAAIDVIFAGLLWCLCSIPVITVGPASAALYYTTVKSVRHERGHVASTFFGAFRANFRISLAEWLIILAYVLLGTANVYAADRMGDVLGPVQGYLSRIMLLPAVFLSVWMFPFISRFENTVKGTFKCACFLMLRHFGRTALMTMELGAFVLAGWLIPLLIPLMPGLCCLIMSYSAEGALREAAKNSEDNNEDKWYNE